jgi:hypothetical protein
MQPGISRRVRAATHEPDLSIVQTPALCAVVDTIASHETAIRSVLDIRPFWAQELCAFERRRTTADWFF